MQHQSPGLPCQESRYIRAINVPRFALECDRYRISDRIASALATSLSQDFELKDYKGEDVIIDRNKIRHEREKSRQKIMREKADVSLVKAFSFDSRSDTTLAPVMIEGRQHPRNVMSFFANQIRFIWDISHRNMVLHPEKQQL